MPGIYIHIPFCRKACTYCDFHFSTSLARKEEMVAAICKEIELRKDYLNSTDIDTIYFGGGTPSLLSQDELFRIFETIGNHFNISKNAEVTLEANPDDLTDEKLEELSLSPVNRLSIGLQTFDEYDLRFMNRTHTAEQSKQCVARARDFGFDNLTIDMIYGIPGRDEAHWEKQLQQALELNMPHISAYALTVEKETVLENWIKKGKVPPVDDVIAERNFYFLSKILEEAGYEHYEISNFAKPGHRAVHNSSYWKGEPYLGLGPSAHSFDGNSRQWNVSNNAIYISSLNEDELNFEKETLSIADQFNETVMTSLRRKEGIDINEIDEKFGVDFSNHLMAEAAALKKQGKLTQEGDRLYIPTPQRFFSDGIAAGLFYV